MAGERADGRAEGPSAAARARRNRLAFLGLVAIAVVPLAGAYLLYQSKDAPWGTTNHGEFLQIPAELADLGLSGLEGEAFSNERVWRLLAVTDAACVAECGEALRQLRQLHVLLNKESPRVQRTLVFLGPVPGARIETLRQRYPHLGYARGHHGPLRDGIFIADPLGNLVLYYRYEQAGRPVLEDLKRLLRVSQIG